MRLATGDEPLVSLSQEGIETTEVVYGEDKALSGYLSFLSRSQRWLDTCGDANAPSVDIGVKEYNEALLDCKRRGFRLRYITEITKDNIHYSKELAKIVELRHLDNMKGNFAVTENQYLSVGSLQEAKPIPMSIFSNVKVIVEQQQFIYESLWKMAIPAAQRISEIEENKPSERTEVIYGESSIMQMVELFVSKTESELKIIASRPRMVEHLSKMEIFHRLMSQKDQHNVMIKLVASFGENDRSILGRISPYVLYKSVDPLPLKSIIFVRDKKEVLLINIREESGASNSEEPLSDTALKSSDSRVVETMLSTFDAWWNQAENTKIMIEEKTHAELLLDLITHDLGNHNQIIAPSIELAQMVLDGAARRNAELSQSDVKDLRQYIRSTARAFERSVSLVDNIRRLEKMYREKKVDLTGQNLLGAINSAISTVRESGKIHKEILFSINGADDIKPIVLADDLLEEIFVNLFANAVMATEEPQVRIDVDIREQFIGHLRYWMVAVSDSGKGIPDDMKSELFTRFYSKARGSGLGLSIVRALVERYRGKVWVGDKTANDYTKGARFSLILHDATSRYLPKIT